MWLPLVRKYNFPPSIWNYIANVIEQQIKLKGHIANLKQFRNTHQTFLH